MNVNWNLFITSGIVVLAIILSQIIISSILGSQANKAEGDVKEKILGVRKVTNNVFKIAYGFMLIAFVVALFSFGYVFEPDGQNEAGTIEAPVGEIQYNQGSNEPLRTSDKIKKESLEDQQESLESFQEFQKQMLNKGANE